MARKRKKITLNYLTKNLSAVVGLVLIWRGIWYGLDIVDFWFFGNDHLLTAFGGVALGLLVLYLPDGDLKEIERL